VTEGYQPPTPRRSGAEQDTATLPRVSSGGTGAAANGSRGAAGGNSGDGWSPVSRSDARQDYRAEPNRAEPNRGDASRGEYRPGDATGGLGARLSAAASTVAASATSAATNAKTAIRTKADEAENRAGRPAVGRASRARQPRRARLTLSHVNVYSVFKFSCVLAIALFFVWLIMIGVLYGILDVSGVFDRVNNAVHQISGDGKSGNVVTGPLVFGFAIIIGVINIVLFIALSTVGAMVYNLCADLVGGAEVTLSERE